MYQSRAWAQHRARTGWRPRHFVFDDGFGVLALERPWPIVGGASAYLPRGPIPADDNATSTADRLDAVAAWLASRGVDVVASDAEVPAATGYPGLLAARGFRPIEEIQPSRHRMSVPLGPGEDEAGAFGGVAKSTRQRIRGAEKDGVLVIRHDTRAAASDRFALPDEPAAVALGRFYDLLVATGERLHFSFGPRAAFVDWWVAAEAAGLLVYLEARSAGEPLAGLVLFRHGGRLATAHSADRTETRRTHPGALHLLRWRALQLAIAEGYAEMDFGGVDVPGARRPPVEGEPMYGLYQHKASFGARWVELSGAHERVIRPGRYLAGRLLARATRRISGSALRDPGEAGQ